MIIFLIAYKTKFKLFMCQVVKISSKETSYILICVGGMLVCTYELRDLERLE